MARHAAIRIGTAGWHYPHWIGPFYPADLAAPAMLDEYARHFDTVEIDNSFYRLPEAHTFDSWRDTVPKGFVFACKASRFITHMKKLREPQKSLGRFLHAVDHLGEKRGPILFQLPPRWRVNLERLQAFLAALPAGQRFVFEFRDQSWWTDAVCECLSRHNAAFCAFDLAGVQSPMPVTADFVYIRLHGPDRAYGGSYGDRALKRWADRICAWRAEGRSVFCYFDNDDRGFAALNALRLKQMMQSEDQGATRRGLKR